MIHRVKIVCGVGSAHYHTTCLDIKVVIRYTPLHAHVRATPNRCLLYGRYSPRLLIVTRKKCCSEGEVVATPDVEPPDHYVVGTKRTKNQNQIAIEFSFSWESSARIRALGADFGDHEIKRSRCFGQKWPWEKTKYIHALTYTYLHTPTTTTITRCPSSLSLSLSTLI